MRSEQPSFGNGDVHGHGSYRGLCDAPLHRLILGILGVAPYGVFLIGQRCRRMMYARFGSDVASDGIIRRRGHARLLGAVVGKILCRRRDVYLLCGYRHARLSRHRYSALRIAYRHIRVGYDKSLAVRDKSALRDVFLGSVVVDGGHGHAGLVEVFERGVFRPVLAAYFDAVERDLLDFEDRTPRRPVVIGRVVGSERPRIFVIARGQNLIRVPAYRTRGVAVAERYRHVVQAVGSIKRSVERGHRVHGRIGFVHGVSCGRLSDQFVIGIARLDRDLIRAGVDYLRAVVRRSVDADEQSSAIFRRRKHRCKRLFGHLFAVICRLRVLGGYFYLSGHHGNGDGIAHYAFIELHFNAVAYPRIIDYLSVRRFKSRVHFGMINRTCVCKSYTGKIVGAVLAYLIAVKQHDDFRFVRIEHLRFEKVRSRPLITVAVLYVFVCRDLYQSAAKNFYAPRILLVCGIGSIAPLHIRGIVERRDCRVVACIRLSIAAYGVIGSRRDDKRLLYAVEYEILRIGLSGRGNDLLIDNVLYPQLLSGIVGLSVRKRRYDHIVVGVEYRLSSLYGRRYSERHTVYADGRNDQRRRIDRLSVVYLSVVFGRSHHDRLRDYTYRPFCRRGIGKRVIAVGQDRSRRDVGVGHIDPVSVGIGYIYPISLRKTSRSHVERRGLFAAVIRHVGQHDRAVYRHLCHFEYACFFEGNIIIAVAGRYRRRRQRDRHLRARGDRSGIISVRSSYRQFESRDVAVDLLGRYRDRRIVLYRVGAVEVGYPRKVDAQSYRQFGYFDDDIVVYGEGLPTVADRYLPGLIHDAVFDEIFRPLVIDRGETRRSHRSFRIRQRMRSDVRGGALFRPCSRYPLAADSQLRSLRRYTVVSPRRVICAAVRRSEGLPSGNAVICIGRIRKTYILMSGRVYFIQNYPCGLSDFGSAARDQRRYGHSLRSRGSLLYRADYIRRVAGGSLIDRKSHGAVGRKPRVRQYVFVVIGRGASALIVTVEPLPSVVVGTVYARP